MKYRDKTAFDHANSFGTGVPNEAYAAYFTGDSFLNLAINPEGSPAFVANVTFEPGCRNHWHIHHAASGGGQLLICTAGEGWYQKEGMEPVSLSEGSVVYIPTGVKHWHGAKADSWFSHIAVEIPGSGTRNEWLEAVDAVYYNNLKG